MGAFFDCMLFVLSYSCLIGIKYGYMNEEAWKVFRDVELPRDLLNEESAYEIYKTEPELVADKIRNVMKELHV